MLSMRSKAMVMGLVMVVFFAVGCASKKTGPLQDQINQLNQIVGQKNDELRQLSEQAAMKQKEIDSLKAELSNCQNELAESSKKLGTFKAVSK